jgi:membrane associated rhomboid family serine protease
MGLESVFKTFGLVPANFRFWQPVTSLFLHGSFLHLFFNMLALWSIGTPIERDIGSAKFTKLYFISGLGGAILAIFLQNPASITIGASSAIMGLLGAMAIFYPDNLLLVFIFPMRARTAAIIFGVISFLFAVFDSGSGISHAGHLGGLIAGILYSKFTMGQKREYVEEKDYISPNANEFGSWSGYDQKKMMREMFTKMWKKPESKFFFGGRFIHHSKDNFEKDIFDGDKPPIKEMKLFFDPKSGKFYYK